MLVICSCVKCYCTESRVMRDRQADRSIIKAVSCLGQLSAVTSPDEMDLH
jgi:hypothetical protein